MATRTQEDDNRNKNKSVDKASDFGFWRRAFKSLRTGFSAQDKYAAAQLLSDAVSLNEDIKGTIPAALKEGRLGDLYDRYIKLRKGYVVDPKNNPVREEAAVEPKNNFTP